MDHILIHIDDTTYVAGCTDPDYTDPNCPHKDSSNQQILGLVQCKDSADATGSVVWSGCPGATSKTALGVPGQCSCSGTASGLIIWPSSLSGVASLPKAAGQTISSISQSNTISTSTSASPAPTAKVTSAPTSSSSSPASSKTSPNSLTTAEKAGIGIGVTALALIILTLTIVFFIWRRRTGKRHINIDEGNPSNPDGMLSPDPYQMSSSDCNEPPRNQDETPYSGHESSVSSWGTVYKPELPVETAQHTYGRAELAADGFYLDTNMTPVEAPMTPVHPPTKLEGQVIRAVRPISPISTNADGNTLDQHTSGTMTMSDLSSQYALSPPSQADVWERKGSVSSQNNNIMAISAPRSEGRAGDECIGEGPNDSEVSSGNADNSV